MARFLRGRLRGRRGPAEECGGICRKCRRQAVRPPAAVRGTARIMLLNRTCSCPEGRPARCASATWVNQGRPERMGTMTAQILDGKATAAAIKSELTARVAALKEKGVT